jgi:hypothetical protein
MLKRKLSFYSQDHNEWHDKLFKGVEPVIPASLGYTGIWRSTEIFPIVEAKPPGKEAVALRIISVNNLTHLL